MQPTKKTQYALRAMIFLARREKKVFPLSVIAKEEDISFYYLEKIFSSLEKKGLVQSKRGATGGYLLSRLPKKITLKDIFGATKEPVFIVDCLEKNCPRNKNCKASKAWRKVNKEVKETLSSITLSDLLK